MCHQVFQRAEHLAINAYYHVNRSLHQSLLFAIPPSTVDDNVGVYGLLRYTVRLFDSIHTTPGVRTVVNLIPDRSRVVCCLCHRPKVILFLSVSW